MAHKDNKNIPWTIMNNMCTCVGVVDPEMLIAW